MGGMATPQVTRNSIIEHHRTTMAAPDTGGKEIFISERPSEKHSKPIVIAPVDHSSSGVLKDVYISQRPHATANTHNTSIEKLYGADYASKEDKKPVDAPYYSLASTHDFAAVQHTPRNQEALATLSNKRRRAQSATIFTKHKSEIAALDAKRAEKVEEAERKKLEAAELAEKVKFKCKKDHAPISRRLSTATTGKPKAKKPWWTMTTADAGKKLMGREEMDLLEFAAGLDLEEYLDNEAVLGALETIKDVIMPKEPEPEPEPVPEQEAVVEQEEAVLDDDTEDHPHPEPALGATQRMQDTRAPSAVPARPRSRPAPVPEPVIEQTISHTRRRAPTVFDEAAPVDLVRRLTRVHSAASIRRVMQTGSGAIVDETMKTGKVGVQGDTVVVRHDPADDLQYSTMDVTNTTQMRIIQRRQRAAFEDPGTLPYLYRNPAI
ncbi:hypothetical protein J8273_2503 [Carpediemonas membranifera]|uniref:Uncharacterized protein n=1 Tax=Carpediemonas membranifera TaxID=201153 RepID=A0A8J6AVY0_9EUKA|nr:hypothetical protein J8273_2503 [Carpediemonas membranifera]|eukprot:KAG9396151.1 hypothetical protein J8273_2503 [Carpediemonas membranifera]